MIRWLSIIIAGFLFLLLASSCTRATTELGGTGKTGALLSGAEALTVAPGDLRVLWGINIDNPAPYRAEFDLASQQGKFRWVRLWFWWRWLETAQGQLDWSPMDAQVSWARENGMQIMASFAGIPPWANGADPNCDITTRGDCQTPPLDPTVWPDFVSQAVRRYHNDIHYWNVWNEPNLTGSFGGSRNDFIGLMQEPAIQAIRSLDPTAKIVGPELAQLKPSWLKELLGDGYWNWQDWLRDLMYYGDGSAYDVISEHVYQNKAGDVGTALDQFHTELVSVYGAGKPVWLTETGFNSVTLGERQQTIEVSNLVDVVEARPWVEHAFYFDIADGQDAAQSRDGLALAGARPDLTPKPAFWMLASRLPDPPAPAPYQPNDPALVQDFLAELERYVNIDQSWNTSWDGTMNWYQWGFYYQKLTHSLGPDSDPQFLYTSHQPTDMFTLADWWSFVNEGVRLDDEPISRAIPVIQAFNFRGDVSSSTQDWFETYGYALVRAPGEQVQIHVACFDSSGARKIPDDGTNDPYILSPAEYIEAVPNSSGQDQFNFYLAPQDTALSCLVRIYFYGTDSFGQATERDSAATDSQAWFTLPASGDL